MLSVMPLYMLMMILLFTLGVIRNVICGKNLLLNLNLIYGTLWTGAGNGLLISMLQKLNWFHLTSLITLVLLWYTGATSRWMGLLLTKHHLLRCWGCLFLLNWIGALALFLLLKLPPKKLEPSFVLWSFFLLRLLCIHIDLP